MDPYIESPTHWADFHATFIPSLREAINDVLPANYVARIDEEIVMLDPGFADRDRRKAGPAVAVMHGPFAPGGATGGATAVAPPVPVTLDNIPLLDPMTELFIEVTRLPEREVVTVVEVLSPTNKVSEGRGLYLDKRNRLLRRQVNIVELDLLRAGRRLELSRPLPTGHYYAFVSRADRRPKCDVYPWTVRDRLPVIPIPLKSPDPDVQVDVARAFAVAYDRGPYGRMIDYGSDEYAPPKFAGADADWVAQTARAAARQ
jgi:hypothetical protein